MQNNSTINMNLFSDVSFMTCFVPEGVNVSSFSTIKRQNREHNSIETDAFFCLVSLINCWPLGFCLGEILKVKKTDMISCAANLPDVCVFHQCCLCWVIIPDLDQINLFTKVLPNPFVTSEASDEPFPTWNPTSSLVIRKDKKPLSWKRVSHYFNKMTEISPY